MAKYVYPAIFTPEEDGYSVRFPDIHNCFTGGADIAEALEMAEDVLCMMLYDKEMASEEIPLPSEVSQMQVQAGDKEFVTLVSCDTVEYRKFHDSRAVKKTHSIPSWLNEMAEQAGINFSGTLQEALKKQLNI